MHQSIVAQRRAARARPLSSALNTQNGRPGWMTQAVRSCSVSVAPRVCLHLRCIQSDSADVAILLDRRGVHLAGKAALFLEVDRVIRRFDLLEPEVAQLVGERVDALGAVAVQAAFAADESVGARRDRSATRLAYRRQWREGVSRCRRPPSLSPASSCLAHAPMVSAK